MKIIVTGGLGALGRAVVAELAGRGHDIAVVDVATPSGDLQGRLVLGGVDLGDEVAVKAAYDDIAGQLGGIDGLVNVAGGFLWETVTDGSLDSWDRMYRMNLRTAVISSRAAAAHMKAGGAIVNIGAAAAGNAAMGMAPYAASKAGIKAFTESFADELKSRSIRVNAVLPTIIDTPTNRADMPDADRSGWVTPAGAARAIAFLLSDEAGTITGASIPLSLPG
ncbi:SDR family NAD(P)-dependent oxidoreductase [Rhizorhabdus phycosphaerae]|uniref:SDR family NAD(P)-dependent oxidoreductase n=1 Tax=Rhizorhabdus phycosphaerae TaxID=2711156 RepID=UPI0019D1315E|nr:SDR family NAD(P)-dependent oxidoreductase [Rhizorhabdus phycosphaerae]